MKIGVTNKLLLVILIASIGYISVKFVSSYQSELALMEDQVTEPAHAADATVSEILDEIDFDVATEPVEVAGVEIVEPVAQIAANRLVVDSMSVRGIVYDGQSASTLDKGIWRIPGTSTPDKGGNTVLAAHRWKWGPQSGKSFYDIDKMQVGDVIKLTWEGTDYTYKVSHISTVTPDKVEILNNTAQPKLTLFSCAPLFSSKYRLVVEADLIS